MKRNKEELMLSEMLVPTAVFFASYNQNLPAGFPRASLSLLKEFQSTHPALFKKGDLWSVARHRKKLLDWLHTHHDD